MAKRATSIETLISQIDRALAQHKLTDALNALGKIVAATPATVPAETIRRLRLRVLEEATRLESKIHARAILRDLEKDSGLTPSEWRQIALCWLELGEDSKTLEIARRIGDADLSRLVIHRAADRAMIDPKTPSTEALTPQTLEEIAASRAAFAAYEAGDIDQAREKLNAIGMASPLMEWKLMLRGLIAYSLSDDLRCTENWSRLKIDRLPAKLVAPLRSLTDPSHPLEDTDDGTKNHDARIKRLISPLLGKLLSIRSLVGQSRGRDQMYIDAESIVGELKTLAPRGFKALANVVYWSICDHGNPLELNRYPKIFGRPERDPNFQRIRAIALDRVNEPRLAHEAWSEHERWVLRNPQFFTVKHLNSIRGALQKKIARAAMDASAREGHGDIFEIFNQSFPDKALRLKPPPSPEPALRAAVELLPDDLEALTNLFDFLMDQGKEKEAEKLAPVLGEKFGDNPGALAILEAFFLQVGDIEQAHDALTRQMAVNPLDKVLRARACALAISMAREHATEGDYDAALTWLDKVVETAPENHPITQVSCPALRGVIAARRKDKETWDTFRTRLMSPEWIVPGVCHLLAEGTRVKLPKKELEVFQAELKAILSGKASCGELELLIASISEFELEPKPYRGLATHLKLLQAAIKARVQKGVTEAELQSLARRVHEADWHKLLKDISETGAYRHPTNPYFWFFQAEAIQAPKDQPMVVRAAQSPYFRAHFLMGSPHDYDLTLLRQLWEERCQLTPDLTDMINEMGFGEGL